MIVVNDALILYSENDVILKRRNGFSTVKIKYFSMIVSL